MEELIVRINPSLSDDVEILYNNLIESYQLEKMISLEEFDKIINKIIGSDKKEIDLKPRLFDESIIGYSESKLQQVYLIRQPEHMRYITYSFDNQKGGMKINFPNSLYFVFIDNNNITKIQAYMYDKWLDKKTKLYKYAMPNMLTDNKICIGKASTEIQDNQVIRALEKIIYSPYSHSQVDNVRGFKNTISYFEYLEKNKIEKKYLIPFNLTLGNLIRKEV